MKPKALEINTKPFNKTSNLFYYAVVIIIFLILKLVNTMTITNDLFFLLKPTTACIELLTGSIATYSSNNGYYFEQLNFLIDKSCSGFNFWLLCFLMFSFLGLKYTLKPYHKIAIVPISLFLSYIATIGINTSRIYSSIILQSKIQNHFEVEYAIIHEAIGVATHLSFLIIIYLITEKLLNTFHHAKLT